MGTTLVARTSPPDLTPEQIDHLRALVDRLEDPASHQYRRQLRSPLDDPEPAYCCLGHACDLSGLGRWTSGLYSGAAPEYDCREIPTPWGVDPYQWSGATVAYLPSAVQAYYGFDDAGTIPGEPITIGQGVDARTLSTLVDLNDEARFTLPQIARVIRERWLGETVADPDADSN